jgi:general secretion pathway protein C
LTHFVRRVLLAVEKRIPSALLGPEGWLRVAVAVVNVVLVIALAYALAGLTLAMLTGYSLSPAGSPALAESTSGSDNPPPAPPVADAAISSWHLFGQADAVRPVETLAAPAPVTPLNLRLVGIFFMERGGDRALALIADSNGPERGYRIGESLPGGARLQRIQRDHVVVSRGGREEMLKLPKLGEMAPTNAPMMAPPDTPEPEIEPMVEPGAEPEAEPVGEPEAEPAASRKPQVIDATAVVSRLRGEVTTRPRALEDIAFASPYLQNGQFIGFRLRPGRDRQLFQQLGLNGGDVLTEINGSRLNSPAQGLTALQEVLNAGQINVRILRNGAEIPLTFSLGGQ